MAVEGDLNEQVDRAGVGEIGDSGEASEFDSGLARTWMMCSRSSVCVCLERVRQSLMAGRHHVTAGRGLVC
jgi:hypothetical protein